MACEPFDCGRCGQRHTRCTGHVIECPACGWSGGNTEKGQPCVQCQEPCIERACNKWPERGASACRSHGGSAPQVRGKAVERRQTDLARRACDKLGVPVPAEEADPGFILIGLVREAAGNVEYYRSLVAELPTHPGPDRFEVGDDDKPHFHQGDPGIYGRTYHQSGIATGEAKPHILVVMYDQERDRLARYVKEALAAGVEERRVRLEEADARELMAGVAQGMQAAQLTPTQAEEFRRGFADYLRKSGGSPLAR